MKYIKNDMVRICYLTKVVLRNYRSIKKDIHLNNLGDITILIGPNEGGKTNILRALKWANTDDPLKREDRPVTGNIGDDEIVVELYFRVIDRSLFLERLLENVQKTTRITIEEEKYFAMPIDVTFVKLSKQVNGLRSIDLLDETMEKLNKDLVNIFEKLILNGTINEIKKNLTNRLEEAFIDSISEILRIHGVPEDQIYNGVNVIKTNSNFTGLFNLIKNELESFFDQKVESITRESYNRIKSELAEKLKELKTKIPNTNVKFTITNKAINLDPLQVFIRMEPKLTKLLPEVDGNSILMEATLNILPEFIYLAEEMELKGEVKKENNSWCETLTENNDRYAVNYRLLSILDVDLDEFDRLSISDQRLVLQNGLDKFSNNLIKLWKQERVRFNVNVAENVISFFTVDVDESNNPLRTTRPESRSRGFKWYLTYLITLEYLKKRGNTILLLDDPAVFLHEKGQKDFLETIENVSKDNQIIYTTHLISLFDERKLERVLLVKTDEKRNTKIEKPWKSNAKIVTAPICHALGIDRLILENAQKVLFVEGISDKFILEGLRHISKEMKELPKLIIHPLSGGEKLEEKEVLNKLKLLNCLATNEDIKYFFLLDGDRKEIVNKKSDITNIVLLGNENQELEDLIDRDFYLSCVKECYQSIFIDNREKFQKLEKIIEKLSKDQKQNKITKKLEKEFKQSGLGGFSKVYVAITIKRRLDSGKVSNKEFQEILNIIESKLKEIAG